MTHRSRNPFRRQKNSTMSEPNPAVRPEAAYVAIEAAIEDYITKPGTVIKTKPHDPSDFYKAYAALTGMAVPDAEQEPPARYTQEQLASKLYSPQGEPITEDEYRQFVQADSKYQRGTWMAADGRGGVITTDYHGLDHRDRPTTPRPWQTHIGQRNGMTKFVFHWVDEETAVRGHHILVKEMTDSGGVAFMAVVTMEMLCKAASEPDRPF